MILQGSEHECGQCHVVFSGLTLFDRHQTRRYNRRPAIVCASPQSLGLVQNARGTWYTPDGLAAAQRSAARLATARSGRTS